VAQALLIQMTTRPIRFSQLFQDVFNRRGRAGCCLVQGSMKDAAVGCGIDRATTRLRPMSTFKIINSMIALDSGVTDLTEEIDWDGGPAWSDELKTRMNLKKALSSSALWYFQILARRIGLSRYRRYLTECGYGNAQCGSTVDNFWLNGTLLISPVEQLEFISKLTAGQLPFSGCIISAVQEMLILRRSTEGVLRGKTGYADSNGEHFGWFMGYLESAKQSLRVVTLLEMSDICQLPERREISEECLRLYSIKDL